ncbi:hypothetical protein DSL72_008120 [Monilinia vaccinii-corymbosi]|uniref:BTB domain-containing protein n=1 Tax=Monilinia vaccinii-corymbosi TaxID=61207 RepID=A0A8A3PJX1_9HELO|nr:hypothetical protein DSL72_008120 [Monilinia vaccinii-corymbosi]
MFDADDENIGAMLGTELVTIIVGEEKRKFVVHQQLICGSVWYFDVAFSTSRFREGQEKRMEMPEDDPEAFELFTHWLYRGSVPRPFDADGFDHLVSLYVFAEKLCINEVADKTIDAIISGDYSMQPEMTPKRVERIWLNTLPTSPLRKWCIHALVDKLCDFETPDEEKETPGFLNRFNLVQLWDIMPYNCDLYTAFFLQAQEHSAVNLPKDAFTAGGWERCYFHQHSEEEFCH